MNPTNVKDKQTQYTALIRWRGPDPAVELETRFPGFDSIKSAAVFAASRRGNSPCGLHLSANSIRLRLGDGRDVNAMFPYDSITVWIRTPPDLANQSTELVGPSAFRIHSYSSLSAIRTAHGEYRRLWGAVLGLDDTMVRMEIIDPTDRPVVPRGH